MASGFLVEKDYTTPSGVLARDVAAPRNAGAGDGDRTHIASLEGWSSAIELHPHSTHRLDPCDRAAIPKRWWRGYPFRRTKYRLTPSSSRTIFEALPHLID